MRAIPRRRGRLTGPSAVQIVATPGSGSGRARDTALGLHETLRARGHEVRLELVPDLDSLRRWAGARGPSFSLLICIGGDGTVSTAAGAAARRSVPFLPVPSGFGNLFARACRHPSRVDRVVELVEHGTLLPVDVGVRNGELFLCQESFGLLFQIQQQVEASPVQPRARWRRWLAYYRRALHHLKDTPLTPFQVAVDGRVVAGDAVVATVSNVETYGRWLRLTPMASPIDGLFDVFVMSGARKRQVLARLLKRQLRLPDEAEGIQVVRGRHVSVGGPQQSRHELDLIPGLLTVVVSSKAARELERGAARAEAVAPAGRYRAA
jgi:diacylglycerol kinase (ATP)